MGLEVGKRINDYEILNVIGAGGMGTVYRVQNVISMRIEAMKVLLPNLASEPELATRFSNEIRTLAALDHPNIAQLRTAIQSDNQLMMIMEFVEGHTLEQLVKQGGLSLEQNLKYVDQILGALAYAHAHGVVHRDVKPSNVMITPDGVVKLMDFGIAKSVSNPDLTRTGMTMGSLAYMSPEQVRGSAVDNRSDLYSTGVMLYELVTGRKPFQAESTHALLELQLKGQAQPPLELNASLPRILNDIILTSLAKEPSSRFQNAQAFRNALKNVVTTPASIASDEPSMARTAIRETEPMIEERVPVEPANNSPHPPVNRRLIWMIAGALAVVAVLAAGVFFIPRWISVRASNAQINSADQSSGATPAPPPASAQTPESPQPSTTPATVEHADPASPNQPSTAQATVPPVTSASVDSGSVKSNPPPALPSVDPRPSSAPPSHRVERSAAPPPSNPPPSASKPNSASPGAEPVANQTTANSEATQTAAAAAAPASPTPEQINALKERMQQISARAAAVRDVIERMRAQQAANGYGLRSDISASLSRLQGDLEETDRAWALGDASLAHKRSDQAEHEIETLEKFIGK